MTMSQSNDDLIRENPHLAKELRQLWVDTTRPIESETEELNRFLVAFESICGKDGTLKERVEKVVRHYATQGGRWLNKQPKRRPRRRVKATP